MEVFAAFRKVDPKSEELIANFFSDLPADSQVDTEDCVFYERNTCLVYPERNLFEDIKPRITIQELFKSSVEDLQPKFASNTYSFPFFIKTYSTSENIMLINKHVEIVGFLSLPQEYSSPEMEGDLHEANFQGEIDPALHPYFSPVLHAVTVRPLPVFSEALKSCSNAKISTSVKDKILGLVKDACRGDMVFGRLFLYSLASLITNRPYATPIDIISLNMYGLSNDHVKDLSSVIKTLAPFPLFQRITLEDLSKSRFYGKKNYDLNCIEPGLPLEDGTTLVLDETNLEIGTLHEVAVKNATMINNIVGLQKRYFDFDYCPFEADCNCTVLGLSKGRSIFEFEHRVKLSLTLGASRE